jgi:hypothetical protein
MISSKSGCPVLAHLKNNISISTMISLTKGLSWVDPLPETFEPKFLSLLREEVVALEYMAARVDGFDTCLRHTLCVKLAGYRTPLLATSDTIDQAEELLFNACLSTMEWFPKDE